MDDSHKRRITLVLIVILLLVTRLVRDDERPVASDIYFIKCSFQGVAKIKNNLSNCEYGVADSAQKSVHVSPEATTPLEIRVSDGVHLSTIVSVRVSVRGSVRLILQFVSGLSETARGTCTRPTDQDGDRGQISDSMKVLAVHLLNSGLRRRNSLFFSGTGVVEPFGFQGTDMSTREQLVLVELRYAQSGLKMSSLRLRAQGATVLSRTYVLKQETARIQQQALNCSFNFVAGLELMHTNSFPCIISINISISLFSANNTNDSISSSFLPTPRPRNTTKSSFNELKSERTARERLPAQNISQNCSASCSISPQSFSHQRDPNKPNKLPLERYDKQSVFHNCLKITPISPNHNVLLAEFAAFVYLVLRVIYCVVNFVKYSDSDRNWLRRLLDMILHKFSDERDTNTKYHLVKSELRDCIASLPGKFSSLHDLHPDIRPLRWKTYRGKTDVHILHTCRWSTDTPCASCQALLERYTVLPARSTEFLASQRSVVVRPVTRFLPDTTNNPAFDLAHVGYRLATLSALPPSVPVSRVKLADAGFYFRGQGDQMICYQCNGRYSGWRNEDNPMEVHRRISPNCPHVVERIREQSAYAENRSPPSLAPPVQEPLASPSNVSAAVNNQQVIVDDSPQVIANSHSDTEDGEKAQAASPLVASATPMTSSEATTGPHSARPQPTLTAQDTMPHVYSTSRNPSTAPAAEPATSSDSHRGAELPDSSLGARGSADDAPEPGSQPRQMFPRAGLDLGGAVYPMYQDMASRRRSFPHWDEGRAPPLDQLILCGMFYAGYADCVRCFYCGVGLKHWEVNDDVWEEHVRWRPSCGYLRAVKGDDYIRRTLARLGREAAGETEDERPRQNRSDASVARPGLHPTARRQQGPDEPAAPARPPANPVSPPTPPRTNSSPSGTRSTPGVSNIPARANLTASTQSETRAQHTVVDIPSRSTTATTTSSSSLGTSATTTTSPSGGCSNQNSASPEDETPSQRVARLQAENRELARRLRCKVCLQEPIDTILMPCGHLVVCETCARNVTHCPLCRGRIRATARVHMN